MADRPNRSRGAEARPRTARLAGLALALLTSIPVLAQDDDGLDALLAGETVGETTSGPAITGFIELRPRVYLSDRNGARVDDQFLVEAEIEFERTLGRGWSVYFRPHVQFDARDTDYFRTEAGELYATYERGRFGLRLGRMVENWGVADTTNPLDLLNRRDLGGDLLDSERHAETGVRLRWELPDRGALGEPTLSLYVMPWFRPTLFAPEGQRFALGTEQVPLVDHSGFEPEGSDETFAALRLTGTLRTAPFDADLQLIASRGPGRLPIPTLAGDRLIPVYSELDVLGGGLRAVANEEVAGRWLAAFTLKAEVAWNASRTYANAPLPAPESHWTYVFGFDRAIHGVLRDPDQLTLAVEYAGETGADDLAARFRPFGDDLILRLFWEANDFARRSIELRALRDLEIDETIVELIAKTQLRKLHEDLQLQLQIQLFDSPGAGSSFFDFFPDNDSVALALRWDF